MTTKIKLTTCIISLSCLLLGQNWNWRIIGGSEVSDPSLYPWMAALVEHDEAIPPIDGQFCGGTLIDPNWVVTAGHCVTISQFGNSGAGIDVLLGSVDLENWAERRTVDYYLFHAPVDESLNPYEPGTGAWYDGHDIALLHLSTPSSQQIIPIADFSIVSEIGTAIGWGINCDSQSSNLLMHSTFNLDNEQCNVSDPSLLGLLQLPYSMINNEYHTYSCIYYPEPVTGISNGDSGGPIVISDGNSGFLLAGISSWAWHYPNDHCDDTVLAISVFTRMDIHLDWINSVINSPLTDVSVTFANRDENSLNLGGTLEVLAIQPEIISENSSPIPSLVHVTTRTHNETFSEGALKHHDWNNDFSEYLMFHDNSYDINHNLDVARFLNVYDVPIGTNIPTDPVLDFLTIYDPWYRDPITLLQPDYPFLPLSEVAPSGTHKVFLNQFANPDHPDAQIYKFGASSLYEVSNLCTDFDHWSGNYVTIANPTNLTTTVVFTDQGASLTANYNGHGDMDEDGTGSVLDLVILVNIILEYTIPTDYQIWAGDLNGDGLIDVADAVNLNDNIVNGCTPLTRETVDTGTARLKFSQIEGLTRSEGMDLTLTIDSDVPVSGVQLEFEYDSSLYEFTGLELTEVSSEFELDYRDFENGITRIVIYPQEDIEIPVGVHDILVVHYSGLGRINHESQISITNPIIVGHRGMKLNVVKQGNDLPTSFTLHPAYPNPFNPETTIRFDVNEPAEVVIKVFRINGREVETLVNSYLNTGNYNITWNATKYPSGIYFIKMNSSIYSATEKVILLK